MTLFAILALGFFLGMRHATDSDHVIAVTTIVSRARSARAALGIGALWGLGHSATMLIVLGAMNLSGALSQINRAAHPHDHGPEAAPTTRQRLPGFLRPLTIGVVHGLAGSAAVTLLVLATIKSASMALLYLAIFGAGTVAGMMLLTVAMALPIAALSSRFARAEQLMARVTGLVSLAFGLFLAYRIGFADGLLLGAPIWTPH
jgi:cytochrome c biogenesis protein CcdA